MNNKFRNRLIALISFLIFLLIGTSFLTTRKEPKPFGVILFISDSMSPEILTATRLYQGGAQDHLHMEEFPHLALTRTEASDVAIADGASSATAIATGQKVPQHSLGVEAGKEAIDSLIEEAARKNRATALISNGSLVNPTVAAFYAKSAKFEDLRDNAQQLTEHRPIDLLIGEGKEVFLPQIPSAEDKNLEPNRTTNLLTSLQEKGYHLSYSLNDWEKNSFWSTSPTCVFLDEKKSIAPSPTLPPLSELVKKAMEHLSQQPRGYFLVIDDAATTEASLKNHGEDLLEEVSNLDQAVATAREYGGPNSLIMVTGKQIIGGMMMNGAPMRHDKGVAVLGVNAQGFPSISWSSGPGNHVNKQNEAAAGSPEKQQSILEEPSAIRSSEGLPVATDSLTLAIGKGSEKLSGFIHQPFLHQILSDQL